MSSAQALQEEQLLELLLQLKKTTPQEAKTILLQQPQIAYTLLAVMVNINALDMAIVQRIIAEYGAGTSAPVPAPAPAPAPPPLSAIPPHLAPQPPYRGGTPTYPPHPPAPYAAQPYPPPPHVTHNPYGTPPPGHIPGYGTPPPAPNAALPSALAAIPEDQKALIMRVIQMTREEVYQLPYTERDNIIKLSNSWTPHMSAKVREVA